VISAEEAYGQCDLALILGAAERWGRCILKRAYGDWTRFEKYKQELLTHSVDLVQLFHYGWQQSKNAADIQMVVDALETALTHPDIETFVLVSGDSDFSAVARKLRAYGKQVVGMGLRRATSEVLVAACDQFVLYDNLVEPVGRTTVHGRERARQLLIDAIRRLAAQGKDGPVLGARLKQQMMALDPAFSELTLGFNQFREFLEAEEDLIEIRVRERGDLLVTLKASAEALSQDQTAPYRAALDAANLRVLDSHVRTEILQDLHELLSAHPGEYTLDEAVSQLKAQYDMTNVLRTRGEVKEALNLLKFVDVVDPPPQSWNLDPLTLATGMDAQDMVDRCESAYISVLLQENLDIEPDVVALLLFGTMDQRVRVEQLAGIAREQIPEEERAAAVKEGWQWPASLRELPELQVVFHDLAACEFDEPATLERAHELNDQALRIRTTNFDQARGIFLTAAKMMQKLLQDGEPGATLTDLKWYLASYCAASAGAQFFRYNYPLAIRYYLAFFAWAKESDPVWDNIRNLVPPVLSFYFAIAANQNGKRVDVQLGRTHPARVALLLYHHPEPRVVRQWEGMARELARVNPTPVRMIIERLKAIQATGENAGVVEVLDLLNEMV
jgi:hypothetical protein